MGRAREGTGTSSVVRSLSVLRFLARNSTGATLVELADVLTLPASTAHRLLGILTQQEFVVRTADKHYVLGPAALVMARGARTMEQVALPLLREMRDRFHETAFLAELIGPRVVCSAVVAGPRPLRLVLQRGSELPLHASGSGRVILAHRDPEDVADLIPGVDDGHSAAGAPHTPGAPGIPSLPGTDGTDGMWSRFERIRELGYDYSVGELDEAVASVSAPLRGPSGATVASLTLAGCERHGDYAVWGEALMGYADQVESQLGVDAGLDPAAPEIFHPDDAISTQETP